MYQQSAGKETGQQYAPRGRDDVVRLPWGRPWGRIPGPEPTPAYVPDIPAVYDPGETQRNRQGRATRIPLYTPLDGSQPVPDNLDNNPSEREGGIATIDFEVQSTQGSGGNYSPKYHGRTALDDAIDRLTSDKGAYNQIRNPEDAERERRELERLRTKWGFRR
ncbi:MAG: hypothetical protein AABX98_06710 [Nanoarchaeota archaeon]